MTTATLSDADVQKIVDNHAPNQGDPWDMAAMLRVAYDAGAAAQEARVAELEADAADAREKESVALGLWNAAEDRAEWCAKYRRAVIDLAKRGYGVRRPKWLIATIDAARAAPTRGDKDAE